MKRKQDKVSSTYSDFSMENWAVLLCPSQHNTANQVKSIVQYNLYIKKTNKTIMTRFHKNPYQPSVQLSIWWVVFKGVGNPKARVAKVAQLSSILSVVPPTWVKLKFTNLQSNRLINDYCDGTMTHDTKAHEYTYLVRQHCKGVQIQKEVHVPLQQLQSFLTNIL